jgi:hypothetical protein
MEIEISNFVILKKDYFNVSKKLLFQKISKLNFIDSLVLNFYMQFVLSESIDNVSKILKYLESKKFYETLILMFEAIKFRYVKKKFRYRFYIPDFASFILDDVEETELCRIYNIPLLGEALEKYGMRYRVIS